MKQKLCVLLALCLLLCPLAACQKTTPDPTPTPTPDDGPQTIVDVPDENELPNLKDTTVNGEEVTLTLVTGSFRRTGGPDFSLYVDKVRYQVNDVEGCCYITTDEGSTYAEIGFRPDTDAETLSGAFLAEYGVLQDSSDGGEVEFGANTARTLAGRTMDNALEAWLVDVEGGCVTMVVCTPFGEASQISSAATDAVRLVEALRGLTLS